MDELEGFEREVGRLRPDPVPDQEVVARHADQLRAAIAAGGGPGVRANHVGVGVAHGHEERDGEEPTTIVLDGRLFGRDRRGRLGAGRSRFVAAAAAAVVVAAVAVATVVVFGDGTSETSVGQAPVTPPSTAAGPPVTDPPPPADRLPSAAPCGTQLPIELPMPEGFEGPLPGLAAPDPLAPAPADGSYAAHYEGATGTVDVRWPSGGNTYGFERTEPGPLTWDWEMDPWSLDGGRQAFGVVFDNPRLGTGECSDLDVVVAADRPDAAEALYEDVQRLLVGPNGPLAVPAAELVTGTSTAAELPPSPQCSGDEPEGPPVDQGGEVDRPNTYGRPREALENFLATDSYLSHYGYEEITLPDGSIAYRHEGSGSWDDNWHAVIHVVPEEAGWRVVSWEGYACSAERPSG